MNKSSEINICLANPMGWSEGGTSNIKVYTDVLLNWVDLFSFQRYDWVEYFSMQHLYCRGKF